MKHPIWATVTDARALFLPHLKSQNDENKKRAQKNPFLKEIRGATRGDEEKMVTTMTTMTMEMMIGTKAVIGWTMMTLFYLRTED